MAAASSPTVTDSGSLISSRLISTGGSGGAGLCSGFGGSGLTATLGGAAGATGAAAAGRAGTTGAAGRDGAGGAAGRSGGVGTTRRGAAGGAAGPAAAGGTRGRGGATGGGGGVGRSTVGSRRTTAGDGVTGAGGGAIEGAGGATTTGEGGGVGKGSGSATGAGATVCRNSVAAGLISSTGSGSTVSWASIVTAFLREVFEPGAALPVLPLGATAAPASSTGGLALDARLGLDSSGKSRPRPSFTRRSLAIAACNGLMGRMKACSSRPGLKAFPRPSESGHTYAPRPSARPPSSTCTRPSTPRTKRRSVNLGRFRRHPIQV